MPSLNWIGKEKIVNHDKDVPFRLMRKNKKYSLGNSENLILEGDNLEALKALMPFYYGKIKCIYIDPPYNTGNEKWVYNDKVNSPKIKEWLGKVVGPEGDDLCRHDKWLCMMYPRLKMLKELLSDDGVIFISIDDNEHCGLKMMMDELFGEENFITTFIWKKKGTVTSTAKNVSIITEYIICYQKGNAIFKKRVLEDAVYPYKDKRGNYRRVGIETSDAGQYARGTMKFEILNVKPHAGRRWKIGKIRADELEKDNRLELVNGTVYIKKYEKEEIREAVFNNFLEYQGTSQSARAEVNDDIFGVPETFITPKPVLLVRYLIEMIVGREDTVLDSFAGSGTTAHAVLDLNKEDGGNRKFILVEMEKSIAKNITAERVRRVARGYSYKKNGGKAVKVAGLGGGFEYVELGEPLFDKDGMINEAVGFEDMARYVYFTETRTNLEKKNIKGNYLGEFGSSHYFLLFNGIDKNVLNRKFIQKIKKVVGHKVVYADKCLLDEEVLEKYQIVFKQIPYQVKVY